MPRSLVGAIALFCLLGLSCGAFAQDGPGETRPDLPAKAVKSSPVSLSFRELDGAYELSYSLASRKSVFARVFSLAGVSIEWRDPAGADEIISGTHRGSLDTIAGELLARRNFIATYEPINAIPRMSHLVVLGASGTAGAAPDLGVATTGETRPTAEQSGTLSATGGACQVASSPESTEPFISAAVSAEAGNALRDRGQILLDDTRILIAGGRDSCTGRASDSAELLDQATGETTPTGRMRTPRAGFVLQKLPSGDVLAFGGDTGGGLGGATDKVERYDVATGQWKPAGLLAMRKIGVVGCSLKDGSVLLVGGKTGQSNADAARTAEIFDPRTQATRPVKARSSFVHADGATTLLLPDGRCLIASKGNGANLEIFDPTSEQFSPVAVPAEIQTTLVDTAQVGLLPDGTVLLVSKRPYVLNPKTGNFRTIP